MSSLQGFAAALLDRTMMPTGIKVAAIVGSILFTINHGAAVVQDEMTPERWISGLLTYLVPYMVNIHGQYVSRSRRLRSRGKALPYPYSVNEQPVYANPEKSI